MSEDNKFKFGDQEFSTQEEFDTALKTYTKGIKETSFADGKKAGFDGSVKRKASELGKQDQETITKLTDTVNTLQASEDKRKFGETLKSMNVQDKFSSDVISKGDLSTDMSEEDIKTKVSEITKEYPEYLVKPVEEVKVGGDKTSISNNYNGLMKK